MSKVFGTFPQQFGHITKVLDLSKDKPLIFVKLKPTFKTEYPYKSAFSVLRGLAHEIHEVLIPNGYVLERRDLAQGPFSNFGFIGKFVFITLENSQISL